MATGLKSAAPPVSTERLSRVLDANGKSALFGDPEPTANARDPQVIKVGDTFYCYYSATPDPKAPNADLCRTSTDLKTWSPPHRVASGGSAGKGRYTAECPFVVVHDGWYYLFRTQHYGAHAQTSVYRSKDPLNFGVDNDDHLVERLPVAAPELFEDHGQLYIAALNGDLHGIWIAKIRWEPAKTDALGTPARP